MNDQMVPFKVPSLMPANAQPDKMYCGKKNCCKKFKTGKRCKKCPGRVKMC